MTSYDDIDYTSFGVGGGQAVPLDDYDSGANQRLFEKLLKAFEKSEAFSFLEQFLF
jgi:hypothetical protein